MYDVIKDYLDSNGLNRKQFAQLIGRKESWMSRILDPNDRLRITPEIAVEIEKVTQGKITRRDLLPHLFGDYMPVK